MHMLKIDTPSLSCNKRGEKNMVIKSDRLLTLEEAAYFLNLSPRTLYRKIHDNELLALKIGSLWRLEPEEVMNYARKQQNRIGGIQLG